MDELLLESARRALFQPRKNKAGISISGWDELSIRLEIPLKKKWWRLGESNSDLWNANPTLYQLS